MSLCWLNPLLPCIKDVLKVKDTSFAFTYQQSNLHKINLFGQILDLPVMEESI